MTGEMMAFVTAPQLEYARDRLDIDVVSTIAYFGLTVTGEGTIDRSGPGWQRWNSAAMDAVIARAHGAGTRVVLSLARFSWSPADAAATHHVLGTAALRSRLADEVAAEVIRRGVDGVNFDFVPVPSGRAADFTELVRRVRADLDRAGDAYQLTVDVTAGLNSWDVTALVAPGGADAIYLIGYEYAGSWSTVAGSTAPYGGSEHDVQDAIDALLRLVPPDRLIVGVSYAGHLWPTATSTVHARTTGPGSDVTYEKAISDARAHGLRFDPVEHSAWTTWQSPACAGCGLTWVQVYFDDARSLAWKWAEIHRRNLLGSGVWTIAFEGAPRELDRAMRDAFLVQPAG
jgi:spore germination protein YaaH